jgi:hypothetical protein
MTYDTLVPFKLPPGFRNNGTAYQAKGRWTGGNLVRFFQDTIQPVGGWVGRTLTGASIVGVPRSSITVDLNTGKQALVIGTTAGIYAIIDNAVTDITPAGWTPNAARVVELDVFGAYVVLVDRSIGTTGPVYYWDGSTATDAVEISNGPYVGTLHFSQSAASIVVTPERFMVMLGGYVPNARASLHGASPTGRLVAWASQEQGTTGTDWTPTDTNSAGSIPLVSNGKLVCGRRSRNLTLLWTTTDLHAMSYIGAPFYYRFDRVGEDCGILNSRAVAGAGSAFYWMGVNKFFRFDGFVKEIPCEVQDYVFGDFNSTYAEKVWAIANPAFDEVTWFYVSAAGTEIDRYVTLCYTEGMEHFTFGALSRTTGVTRQPTGNVPVMLNSTATVYDHETGHTTTGVTPYLESGPLEIDNGDNLASLLKVIPDDKTVGDVNLTVYTSMGPDFAETTNGPYTLAAQTSIRLKARQMRFKLTQVAAAAWRVGVIRFGIVKSSRR